MITEGTAIRLRELQSRPELNGEAGVVVGPPTANGRYPVRLSSGTALSAKPENLLSQDTQGGFDFDSIFEKALELELLSESEFDAITDAVAQGATTEGELLEVWIERVLDGARLHRPKLECNVGVLRDGSRMIVGLDPDDFDSTREGGYAEDELLGIGRPADFASLELYAEIHLPGDGATPLCTEANARIAAGVKKALAAQGVWGASQADQVHPIAAAAKALQPIAIAMFLGRPEWLSRDELLLAARSGFVIPAKPMLEFRKVTSWRLLHLLPLLKAALEPTGRPADSYAVALQWLRARLAAHFGPLLLLEAMHAALAKGETLEQAVRRVKLIIPGTKPDSKPPPALRRVVAGAARDDGAAGARLALGFDVALGLEEDVALGLEEADALDLEVVLPTLALDAAIAKGVWSGTDGDPVLLPWPEIATLADDAAVPMLSYEPGGAAAATARALPDLHLMQAVEVGLGTMRKGCLALSGRPPPASAAPRAPRPADVLSRQLSGRRAPRSATESIGMARYESRGEAGVARFRLGGKRCAVAWAPQSKRYVRAVAYPTAFASTGERNAYSLATAGATVVAGNTTHNGGGTLLRREPRSALDDANSSGLQVFDDDVLELVVGVAEGSPQGLEWVKVAKAGVGAGWIFARNVHVQGHAHVGAAGRFNMPSVPGVQSLHVPPPPGWQQPQPANLQLVALEPKSDIWRDLDARLRSSLPGATLLRVEQIQSANLWRRQTETRPGPASPSGARRTGRGWASCRRTTS